MEGAPEPWQKDLKELLGLGRPGGDLPALARSLQLLMPDLYTSDFSVAGLLDMR